MMNTGAGSQKTLFEKGCSYFDIEEAHLKLIAPSGMGDGTKTDEFSGKNPNGL